MIYVVLGLVVVLAVVVIIGLNLKKRVSVSGGVIRTNVEIEPLPETQLKENRVSRRDTYSFTLDVENLIRICMSDPGVREMVYSGLRKGPIAPTEVLGAANMKEEGESEDSWFSVFAGTSRESIAGQNGFLLRNKARGGGPGARISLRLKKQSAKTHTAQVPAQTPGEVIPEAANATANLLRAAIGGNKEAAEAILRLANTAQPVEQQLPAKELTLKL
jgi:hypothetical protein